MPKREADAEYTLIKENFICVREDNYFMSTRHVATFMLMAEWQARYGFRRLTVTTIADILGYVGYQGPQKKSEPTLKPSFIGVGATSNICKELERLGLFTKNIQYELARGYEDILKFGDEKITDQAKDTSKASISISDIFRRYTELMEKLDVELLLNGAQRKVVGENFYDNVYMTRGLLLGSNSPIKSIQSKVGQSNKRLKKIHL